MKSKILTLGVAAFVALSVQPMVANAAQGDWLLRAGVGYVAPKDDNLTNLAGEPGLDLTVDDGASLSVEAAYMFRDNWAVEILGALPFSHDVKLSGAGKVAEVKHLPPVVSLQYHFSPEATVRPYIGAGVNYTTFFDEDGKGALNGVNLKLDDSWGLALQVGLDFDISDSLFANVGIRYIDIESDLEVGGAKVGTVEIDPFVYQLHIGYRLR